MNTLIIKNGVRGGKVIKHGGDIIVLGNVAPGATLEAGGNIMVTGVAQGQRGY